MLTTSPRGSSSPWQGAGKCARNPPMIRTIGAGRGQRRKSLRVQVMIITYIALPSYRGRRGLVPTARPQRTGPRTSNERAVNPSACLVWEVWTSCGGRGGHTACFGWLQPRLDQWVEDFPSHPVRPVLCKIMRKQHPLDRTGLRSGDAGRRKTKTKTHVGRATVPIGTDGGAGAAWGQLSLRATAGAACGRYEPSQPPGNAVRVCPGS